VPVSADSGTPTTATPSAAAEIASPEQSEWSATFMHMQQRLSLLTENLIKQLATTFVHLSKRLQHPGQRLQQQAQHLDHLEQRLLQAWRHLAQGKSSKLMASYSQFALYNPQHKILHLTTQQQSLQRQLVHAMNAILKINRQQLLSLTRALDTINPLATLNRGYSITTTASNEIARDCEQLAVGDVISTRLANGELISKIEKIKRSANG